MTTIFIRALTIFFALSASAALQAADSPLGTPASHRGVFSNDYPSQIKAALPAVDAEKLAAHLRAIASIAADEKPLAVTDLPTLRRFFGFRFAQPEKAGDLVDAGHASYRFDPTDSRLYVAYRHQDTNPFARAEFAKQLPLIRARHEALLKKLAVDPRQLFFTDFRETLSQTNGSPKQGLDRAGDIESVGATSVVLRGIDGMIVEGSRVIIGSVDADRIELVDVKWPPLVLSPLVFSLGVVTPADHAEYLAKRIETTSKGRAINTRMAVVLRPVATERGVVHVPSLKVGVQPQAVKQGDGYLTEAGEVFFVDLVKTGRIEGDVQPVRDPTESVPLATQPLRRR